jgi:tetraacyldisaccharide 4'-kinase
MKRSSTSEDWFISVVSGQRHGPIAAGARLGFAALEPIYTGIIHARNFLYTRRILRAAHARRPVVSVGNVTTGGTGKTPMVAWLVGELRKRGRSPAVLLRGYRSTGGASDEELLLRSMVSTSPVEAQPDRFAGSERVLSQHPEVDAFVLDDGLQHRQLARYFSIVLVDATAPFGFDHVLPRGLLREPMRAFRRANAVVITRADLATDHTLNQVEARIRQEQHDVPIFRVNLTQDRLLDAEGCMQSIEGLRGRSVFAFCGIGNPDAFFEQLRHNGANLVGTHRLPDHHAYTADELSDILQGAKQVNAELALTTEKDWVKIAPLAAKLPAAPPILRAGVSVHFHDDAGAQLVELVMKGIVQGDELLGWRSAHNA